jgi:hypothetical protein
MDEYTEAVLDQFTARQADDDVKTDLELVHDPCGTIVCDIQAGDTLAVLVRTALNHEETACPAYGEGSEDDEDGEDGE